MTILTELLLGYLLGSIPFGLVLTRVAGLGDIRNIGSGNIGATNVLRTGNKGLAAATLLLDGLKGAAAVFVAPLVWSLLHPSTLTASALSQDQAPLLAGFAAFLGHLFPVWLRFQGGKGVATYIGVLFALVWPVALVLCVVWLLVAFLTRYSSLAALVASGLTPVILWLQHGSDIAVVYLLMTLLLFWKHRDNIARLATGTESKIGAPSTIAA